VDGNLRATCQRCPNNPSVITDNGNGNSVRRSAEVRHRYCVRRDVCERACEQLLSRGHVVVGCRELNLHAPNLARPAWNTRSATKASAIPSHVGVVPRDMEADASTSDLRVPVPFSRPSHEVSPRDNGTMPSPVTPEGIIQAAQLTHLRQMYADLNGWRERSRILEEPQPGSELDRDTAATHGMGVPLHTLAKHPLVSGTQHLNLARAGVEAREVFPIAHPTALRGALLSASRGVWMLHSPHPDVRQARAARVALEMHQRLLEWIREPENGLEPENRSEADLVVGERVEELRDRQDVRAISYSDTGVVRLAGEIVFDDEHTSGAVVALWRQLSGDAHGLLWTTMTRGSTIQSRAARDPRYPLPMVEMTSGGDLRDLVDAFSAAFRILKAGWSLFDQRCTAP
jgi:hypothetical protein